jgi:hypothetical protein
MGLIRTNKKGGRSRHVRSNDQAQISFPGQKDVDLLSAHERSAAGGTTGFGFVK